MIVGLHIIQDHHGAAAHKGAQSRGRQAEAVEHGYAEQEAIRFVPTDDFYHGIGIGNKVSVSELHPLGHAGGAGGEENARHFRGIIGKL